MDVGEHEGLRHGVFGRHDVIPGHEQQPARRQNGDRHGESGRPDSANTANPERGERKSAVVQFSRDLPRDQEPGDHEKHVHAHVATGHPRRGVKQNHGQNGHGPQAVDVRPVACGRGSRSFEGEGWCWRSEHGVVAGRTVKDPSLFRTQGYPGIVIQQKGSARHQGEIMADRAHLHPNAQRHALKAAWCRTGRCGGRNALLCFGLIHGWIAGNV